MWLRFEPETTASASPQKGCLVLDCSVACLDVTLASNKSSTASSRYWSYRIECLDDVADTDDLEGQDLIMVMKAEAVRW